MHSRRKGWGFEVLWHIYKPVLRPASTYAGSEHRRRHRSPGLGTAHPRFSGGPFDLLGPISSPERQPRLKRSVRRRVMNARRTTNHPVARTYLSTETPLFGWISRAGLRAAHARAAGGPSQRPIQRCLMKSPVCSSAIAWRSCSCVFITIGPYHATGSSIGLPDTSRNRIPSSAACTTISSPRSKSTSE